MANEWGPWIKHDGNGCPCVGQYVRSETADGSVMDHIAHGILEGEGELVIDSWDWDMCDASGDTEWKVIRYRIRKPRGLTILQEIVADPQPVMEDA